MMEESVKSSVKEKVIENFKLITQVSKEITLNDSLESLEVNSIMFIKIIIGLEEEFEIEFDDDKLFIKAFPMVKDFVSYIEEIIGK